MKKNLKIYQNLLILMALAIVFQSWGFYGHRKINRMAVLTLPPEIVGFYKENIEYITSHAVDPDKRRYANKNEAPRHYIDIDHYAKSGEDPFDLMPRYWKDAVEKYTEDTLTAYGIVPWHVSSMVYYLTEAFKANDANAVLRLSADLGHYVADAHVPLHTTENYNGQLTGQRGIHGLWESRIPELKAEDYDFLVGRAVYVKSPINRIWAVVEESHSFVDSVLFLEKKISQETAADQKYAFEQRGQSTVRQYAQKFALNYDQAMGDMVEERMQKAVLLVGSFWYTAWVNAGQPNLDNFGKKLDLKALEKESEELENQTRGKPIQGREHDN